ncbi:MAG: hypothetical protein J6U00_12075 [Ruminococcus sp.]|uniref:hypothetical protein n=1 Tax=Ruminococcus sp. TaxID=41978 RepID=UPI001B02ADF7|nr:hypothetical protein [Ruminococcus sp.]MBO7474709.1 hypothetical protein [Ruminococcus sp.]
MSVEIIEKMKKFTAAGCIGFANAAKLSETRKVSNIKYINERMSISAGEAGCGFAAMRSCGATVLFRSGHTYSIAFRHNGSKTGLQVSDTAMQQSQAAHNADRESAAVCASEEKGNTNSIKKRCYNDWEN